MKAIVIILIPAIWWGWTPMIRYVEFSKDPTTHVVQFMLPAVILGIASAAAIMRLTRGMLLEVLRQDYVRTAWAKGVRERVVVLKHALKNALIPVVTVLGLQVAQIASGAVIIEMIFSLPGMGQLLVESIIQRDYPVIQGINLLIVSMIVRRTWRWISSTRCSTRGSGTEPWRTPSTPSPFPKRRPARGGCRAPPPRAPLRRQKPLGAMARVIIVALLVLAVFAGGIAPYHTISRSPA